MANITTYFENKLLAAATGTAFTPPTTYAALFTTTPTVNYTLALPDGVEVATGIGYPTTRLRIGWQTPSSGIIKNTNTTYALTWTASSQWASGAPITTIGIFDSSVSGANTTTTGNLLWFGPLFAPVIMNSGDTLTIPTDSLSISIS